MGWIVLLLIVVAIAAAPVIAEQRRAPIDDAARKGAPGKFAKLSDGITHYQWHGPVKGQKAVCIHGLTTPSYVWDGVIRVLTVMGFRVLTYDLYGRGLSDRPNGAQTRAFFTRQLRELLADQGVDESVMLVGYSMGGSIATVFTAQEPDRVDHLVLIAPGGLVMNVDPFTKMMMQVPYLGDWLHTVIGARTLRQRISGLQGASTATPKLHARQSAEIDTRGFVPAVLSSRRNMLSEILDDDHREIKAAKVPVLAIWGEQDTSIPLSALGRLAEVNRDARHETIPGATHWLPQTHPREIHAALQEFLRDVG